MEGLSIIIPVFNKIEITLKCIGSIKKYNRACAYEIIIVDNGSTDGTRAVLSEDKAVTYIRNEENAGAAGGFNRGAGAAGYGILCFMHNDVFVFRDNWTAAICDFLAGTANTGVAGLYGAKTMRRDGSFRGRTIVHAEKDNPLIRRPYEKVAVVDGLLMAVRRPVFERIGGYCEDYSFHFYDKDISLRALRSGFDNYVLNIPFEHACAATRRDVKDDDGRRDEDKKRFLEKWSGRLPADVTAWHERIGYLVPFNFPKFL